MKLGDTPYAWIRHHRQMYGGGTHSEAARKFFRPELPAGGVDQRLDTCVKSLPEPIPYW